MINWIKSLFIKKYSLEEVFTPTQAAKVNYIERATVEKQIIKSIKIPGTQIILYGNSGGGKTTIIRKVLNSLNRKYIITSCTSSTTVEEIIINAFDKLNPYYTSEKNNKRSNKTSSSLKISYGSIASALSSEMSEETSEKRVRVLPIQLTFEKLGEFLGEAEVIWIIEDFHKVGDTDKQKLSDIMKAFVDLSNDYPKVKIVAIGAESSARKVVSYSPDINSRVAEISIPLLSNSELQEIILNGAKLLNLRFDIKLVKETMYFSNFLGSLCHQLCYSHCSQMEIFKTNRKKIDIPYKVLKISIEDYVSQKSDTFQQSLDKALKQRKAKYENVKLILKSIISIGRESVSYSEILNEIQEIEQEYPQGNLTTYLKPLTTTKYNEIIRYDENSGKYSFSDPFFKAYCAMSFDKVETVKSENKKEKLNDIQSVLKKIQNLLEQK